MGQDTQNIEARLCAYLDGELDASERQQIERHLQNNPEHAQLIADLMAQRQMLRDLPRESAPADMAQAIQSQLERSALLDGDAGVPRGLLHLHNWQRYAAMAAIVLLTLGLAMVVYMALLPGQPSLTVAHNAPKGFGVGEIGERAVGADEGERRLLPDTDVLVAKGAPPTARAGTVQVSGQVSSVADVFARQAQPAPAQRANSRYLLVVNTRNPDDARTQVAQYLSNNNIEWSNTAQPMPQPLNLPAGQVVEASGLHSTLVQMKEAHPAVLLDSAAAVPKDQPTTRQAAAVNQAQVSAEYFVTQNVRWQQLAELQQTLAQQHGYEGSEVYQYREEAPQVSQPPTSRPVLASVTPTTQPSEVAQPSDVAEMRDQPESRWAVLQVGDVLSIEVPGLAEGTADAARLVKINEDGQIALPWVGLVSARRLTEEQLAQVIQQAYADKNIPVSAAVSVRKVVLGMAEGQSLDQHVPMRLAQAPPTSEPSTEPAAPEPAQTLERMLLQQAPAASQESSLQAETEQPVDLVIVVQSEKAATTDFAPAASMPAAASTESSSPTSLPAPAPADWP